jgi:hypothetical protein
MKIYHLFTLMLLFATASLLHAQSQSETRALRSFNSIKVGNSIDAVLVKGNESSIEIQASGIDLDKIQTNVNNQTLEVKLAKGNFKSNLVKVKITYVDIDEVQASTSAKVVVKDPLKGQNVHLFAATSSYLEVVVNAGNLIIEANTNAKIFVKGEVTALDLKIDTNADVDGRSLNVDHAEVKGSTAAKANFHVNESIKGSAATASKITYSGDPRIVDVRTNTAGEIKGK